MLPADLISRSRSLFLECYQFESDERLRAFFETPELKPFQNRLQGAASMEERVDKTLELLLRRRLSGNRSLLPIFVTLLVRQYVEGDQLYDDLRTLTTDIEQSASEKMVIPFLIMALRADEAFKLFDGSIFDDKNVAPARRDEFDEFLSALQTHAVGDLSQCYGSSHREWRPPFCEQQTIEVIISETLEQINELHRDEGDPELEAEFVSKYFFSSDRNERLDATYMLRNFGGVVVVDAVSMFHPLFSDILANSQISALGQVAMLVISPVDATTLSVNQQIESILNHRHEQAYSRFDTEFDRLCDIDLGNIRSLKRWLIHAVPETAKFIRDPSEKSKRRGRRRMQKKRPERVLGLHRVFAGGTQ